MYPHEFSGGMRQRAMIAMAITCKPDLLIADEPTTALDVTVQAQVLEVLLDIKDEIDSAIMLITHDLGVVAGLADRVMVMYAGRQVEMGTTDEIFYETRHPYTLGLLARLPRLDDAGDEPLVPIVGSPAVADPQAARAAPSTLAAASRGCPGCATPRSPALRLVAGDAHLAACHYAEEPRGDDGRDAAGRWSTSPPTPRWPTPSWSRSWPRPTRRRRPSRASPRAAAERGVEFDGRPNDPESVVAGRRRQRRPAGARRVQRGLHDTTGPRGRGGQGRGRAPVDAPSTSPVGDAPADVSRRRRRNGGPVTDTARTGRAHRRRKPPLLVASDLVKDFPIRGGVFGRTVGRCRPSPA